MTNPDVLVISNPHTIFRDEVLADLYACCRSDNEWILMPWPMHEFIGDYRPPFEAVANRAWLFRTFGICR